MLGESIKLGSSDGGEFDCYLVCGERLHCGRT
jgi:hypothetical protein